jgi:hypothetical protein
LGGAGGRVLPFDFNAETAESAENAEKRNREAGIKKQQSN